MESKNNIDILSIIFSFFGFAIIGLSITYLFYYKIISIPIINLLIISAFIPAVLCSIIYITKSKNLLIMMTTIGISATQLLYLCMLPRPSIKKPISNFFNSTYFLEIILVMVAYALLYSVYSIIQGIIKYIKGDNNKKAIFVQIALPSFLFCVAIFSGVVTCILTAL